MNEFSECVLFFLSSILDTYVFQILRNLLVSEEFVCANI